MVAKNAVKSMLKKISKNWLLVRFFLILSIFTLLTCNSVASSRHMAAIASAHKLATQAGETVLAQGGNAFDAAVAVSAALAVVEPYASGLGGGGFWLLHRASDGQDVMIDGRETAPSKASVDMYLDEDNMSIPGASLNGPLAAAIPGTPAALHHIAKKYGQLPLAQSLAPAIKLARDGFRLDARFANTLKNHQEKLSRYADTARFFLDQCGDAPIKGVLLRQPALAATLDKIANKGRDGFYRGWVAQELVRSVQQSGGIWQLADLVNYRVIERKPVKFKYRGTQVTTASLPSSGGLTMAQAFNIIENFELSSLSELNKTHVIIEAMRHAYQDRMRYLGDSDFVEVPEEMLLSKVYARNQAAKINFRQSIPSPIHSEELLEEGTQTTHFSVVDKEGNRVAATMSVNTFFGSGFVAGKTGVLLNNEMDDFSVSQDVPNVFGLYGMKSNYIKPGKRPLSSMSPTFVEDEKSVLIVGTPGGSRIISMVMLAIIDYVDHQQTNPMALVSNPRFHHQYLPDYTMIEPESYDDQWVSALRSKGHVVQVGKRRWGNMQLIYIDKKTRQSQVANDPRGLTDTRY